jgi:putative glutamine amidotransferase
MPLYDFDKDSIWMLPGYLNKIEKAGGLPVVLPLSDDFEMLDQILKEYDGFLFTGGQDVDPCLYGQKKLPVCEEVCRIRDRMESYLIPQIMRMDKPLLGICRGIQILNAVLGGTLYQDLPTQLGKSVVHSQSKPYSRGTHTVTLKHDTKLYEILGVDTLNVNSMHHQGICNVAPSAKVGAVASDGRVEAIEIPNKRMILAVQWHPEYLNKEDTPSKKLFSLLVEKSLEVCTKQVYAKNI